MLTYVFFILHVLFAVFIIFLCLSFVTGGPFVPTKKSTAQRMVSLAQIRTGMTVVDLGSGDGRILRLAAGLGAHAIGYEMNPVLVLYSRFLSLFHKNNTKILVRWQNLWTANLRPADRVFVYLLPVNMDKLKEKLLRELRPGSLVVTNSFLFSRWKPLKSDQLHHVYVYKVGKRNS